MFRDNSKRGMTASQPARNVKTNTDSLVASHIALDARPQQAHLINKSLSDSRYACTTPIQPEYIRLTNRQLSRCEIELLGALCSN